MTDKQTGARAAAKEVNTYIEIIPLAHRTQKERTDGIEAIILKHCPQDKAEKLVEALRSIEDTSVFLSDAIASVRAAIAEYERAQGD